jgi:uncharacterized repeat protein (TIGR02543 family)
MKRLIIFVAAILAVLTIFALSGCTNVSKLSFEQKDYFVLPDSTFTPNIKLTPKKADYTLTSSNPKIAKINGNQVITLQEGIVTLTVEAGGRTDEARLVVISDESYTGKLPPIQPEYKRISFIVEDYIFASPMEIQKGMVPGTPYPILRAGYDLDGWYTDDTYTEKFDFNKPLQDDTTVYGFWVMREAEFTFQTIEGKAYLSGLLFPRVPYTQLTLPQFTKDGTEVYGIKDSAFKGNASLKKVVIPDSYISIGQEVFRDCAALEEVVFGQDSLLERIGPSAFNNCAKLSEIVLPPLLTELGNFAFYKCAALDIDSLPAGVTRLEQYVLSGTATDSIDLINITRIFEGAFDNCKSLAQVQNTQNVIICYKYAFRGTPALAHSLSTTRIGYIDTLLVDALDGTTSFTLKEGVTMIANDSLVSAGLANLFITINGAPPQYVGSNVFNATTTIILDDEYFQTVRTEDSQWYNYRAQVCTELTHNDFSLLRFQSANEYYYDIRRYSGEDVHLDLTTALPYAVRTIRTGAFRDTVEKKLKLKSLTLGAVDNIADFAINNISTLLAIIINSNRAPTLGGVMSISKNTLANGCVKIYVPNALYLERNKIFLGLFGNIIFSQDILNDGLAISAIPGSSDNHVIQYFGDASTLIIPDDIDGTPINIISENALRYNYSVQHVVFGANVTQIREAALAYNNIKTIEFLSQVPPTLGLHFMYQNTGLEKIYVPQGAAESYRNILPSSMHNLVQERD